MLKKLLFYCSFMLVLSVQAQNAQQLIDNLKTELKSNPDAKKTASIYNIDFACCSSDDFIHDFQNIYKADT